MLSGGLGYIPYEPCHLIFPAARSAPDRCRQRGDCLKHIFGVICTLFAPKNAGYIPTAFTSSRPLLPRLMHLFRGVSPYNESARILHPSGRSKTAFSFYQLLAVCHVFLIFRSFRLHCHEGHRLSLVISQSVKCPHRAVFQRFIYRDSDLNTKSQCGIPITFSV